MKPALITWASEHFDLEACQIEQLPVEASTRKFWRCTKASESWVLMDSPPATENNEQFVTLSDVFFKAKVPVPRVIACDLSKGFLVVSDVGKRSFLSSYQDGTVAQPLKVAIQTILKIQTIIDPAIPPYTDERLHDELKIFREYVCEGILDAVSQVFLNAVPFLVSEIGKLPSVTVHRDFHCMNLLLLDRYPYIGVVDFQDALVGPVSYDLASLLFDCYWNHSQTAFESALSKYWNLAIEQNIPTLDSLSQLDEAVKITAIQRLLKAAGIFVRLWSTKSQITHIPYVLPTLEKARSLCDQVRPLNELGAWLQEGVISQVSQRLESVI